MISADTMRSLPDCRRHRRPPPPPGPAPPAAHGARHRRRRHAVRRARLPGHGRVGRGPVPARPRAVPVHRNRRYEVPSEFVIRDVLVRVTAPCRMTMRGAIYTDDAEAEAEANATTPTAGKIGGNQYRPHPRRRRPAQRRHPHPKKVGLPVGADDEASAPSSPCSRTCGSTSEPHLQPTPDPAQARRTRGAHFVFTPRATSPPSSTSSSRTAASPTSASPPPSNTASAAPSGASTADSSEAHREVSRTPSASTVPPTARTEPRPKVRRQATPPAHPDRPRPRNTTRLRRFDRRRPNAPSPKSSTGSTPGGRPFGDRSPACDRAGVGRIEQPPLKGTAGPHWGCRPSKRPAPYRVRFPAKLKC